ncbi:MAG: hypothetical protein VYD64_08195 [Pseudomonadota bacterium]|nr:hypothetical protein [Pseudomonadota bacterium]
MILPRLAAFAVAGLIAAPSAQADTSALLDCDHVADLDQAELERAKNGIRIGNYRPEDSSKTLPITIRFPDDSSADPVDIKAAVIAFCRKRGD